MRKLYMTLLGTCFVSSYAYASPETNLVIPNNISGPATMISAAASGDEIMVGAQNFIENVASRGLSFLNDPNISKSKQRDEFSKLLNDSFDLKTIGRFALGRYWRQATPEQQKEYLVLFEKMVVQSYAERFDEYQGQSLVVENARRDGDHDTIVFSKIAATNSAPDIDVDWRVRFKNGQYRVVDVLVEGVSMSVTQRSEYASIIQRGGGSVEALLDKLRN